MVHDADATERPVPCRCHGPCVHLARLVVVVLALACPAAACRDVITRKYEYEEDVYLRLDGSATVYVNAAVPALVALRDAPLPLDPDGPARSQRRARVLPGAGRVAWRR